MRLTPNIHKPGTRVLLHEGSWRNVIFYWSKFEATVLEWSPEGHVKLRLEGTKDQATGKEVETWYSWPPVVDAVLPDERPMIPETRRVGMRTIRDAAP